eukprot:m.996495 g.996495  ORF g.996495 m.996495 type:complete len:58 (+) comp24019_c0_seq42:1234-1407(+)
MSTSSMSSYKRQDTDTNALLHATATLHVFGHLMCIILGYNNTLNRFVMFSVPLSVCK